MAASMVAHLVTGVLANERCEMCLILTVFTEPSTQFSLILTEFTWTCLLGSYFILIGQAPSYMFCRVLHMCVCIFYTQAAGFDSQKIAQMQSRYIN